MINLRFRLTFITAVAASLGCASVPANAMQQDSAQSGEDMFVDLGRWIIVQDERARACELRLTSDPQVILRYRMADGRAGIMALQRRTGRFFTGMVGDVEWAFDGTRFVGGQSAGGYSLAAGSRDVEAGFRSAKTLYVTHGGSQIAQISLKTSSAAFRLLKQCSEQWRYIPWFRRLANARYRDLDAPTTRDLDTAPTAPSARSRAAMRESGVAPPLERRTLTPPVAVGTISPTPINPASWIKSDDSLPWPSRGFRSGQGVLRYTLIVDEGGRAEDCVVDASTGLRRFDRQVCRLLVDRAQFNPARGSDGEAVEGSYSASVRFAGE